MLNGEDCMTTECHTQFKEMKQLHFPADDNCTRCHDKTGKHKFKLVNQVDVCFDCHDENRKGKYVHSAITKRDCVGCHDPHGGPIKYYLKSAGTTALCASCHEKEATKKKVVHAPLETGDCADCHRPHAADHEFLLKSPKDKLCLSCHGEPPAEAPSKTRAKRASKKARAGKAKSFIPLSKYKHVHSIVEQGCSECHDPHTTDFKYLLPTEPGDICVKCHEDIGGSVPGLKHAALESYEKCIACHDPHGSQVADNLKKKLPELCLSACHNRTRGKSDGTRRNVAKDLTLNPFKHAPLEEGECLDCHAPHNSGFYRLFTSAYPPGTYAEYKPGAYEFCFNCHDEELVKTKATTTATNFRDGSQNLHYLHVNRKKGRTCLMCHEGHSGKLEKMLRQTVPFGTWSLPIGFTRTPTGGTCSPGCHKPFDYKH